MSGGYNVCNPVRKLSSKIITLFGVRKILRKTFSMSSFAEWEKEKLKPSSKNNNLVLIPLSWNNIRFLKTFQTHKKSAWLGIRQRIEYNRHYPSCIEAANTGRWKADLCVCKVLFQGMVVAVGDQTRTWHLHALQSSDALCSTRHL